MSRPEDGCREAGCAGRLGVYSTHVRGDVRTQYLRCRVCGARPADNKAIVPLNYAPRRQPRRLILARRSLSR